MKKLLFFFGILSVEVSYLTAMDQSPNIFKAPMAGRVGRFSKDLEKYSKRY